MANNRKKLMLREEEERKMAIKYADLLPEYFQLEKEIQQARKKLQKVKLKRDNLNGVLRFLRQKHRTLKKIAADSKASEMGHVNQYVRTSPHMDQNCESTTLATVGKEIAATAKFQYATKSPPTHEENIATQFQSTTVSPIDEKTVALQQKHYVQNHWTAREYKIISG